MHHTQPVLTTQQFHLSENILSSSDDPMMTHLYTQESVNTQKNIYNIIIYTLGEIKLGFAPDLIVNLTQLYILSNTRAIV